MHVGVGSDLAKAKGEAITAWSALTGRPSVSATEAVSGMLEMSWLRAHLYASLLEEQVTAAQEERDEQLTDAGGGSGAGPVGSGEGLVGHTFAAVKDIGIYASGEAIRALAQLEAQERDRCVRYGKTAHDMGIAEQEIEISRQQGLILAETVRRIADGMLAAVLGVLDAQAGPAVEQVVTVIAAEIRRSWPIWLGEIVPREFRAIQAGGA
jgi:hypothetical protein